MEIPSWLLLLLLLLLVLGGGEAVYTPWGDFYVEQETDYHSPASLTGRKGSPTGVSSAVAFSRALEPDHAAELVAKGRAEAAVMTGGDGPDPSAPESVDWRGGRLDHPAYSPGQAPRLSASGRRLRGKQAVSFLVGDAEGAGAALVPASEPGGGTPTPPPEAADGYGWLCGDLARWVGSFAFGTELRPSQPPRVGLSGAGERGIAAGRSGGHHPVEPVELGRMSEWREAKLPGASRLRGVGDLLGKRMLGYESPRPSALAPSAARAEAAEVDDLRVRWINYDDAGVRYRGWKKVLQEATQESAQTAGLRGPPVCLPVGGKLHRHGRTPKVWFAEWARGTGISRKDRAWPEVDFLIECLWLVGSDDQLNVDAAAALDAVAWRLLQHVEAYAGGVDNPRWSAAKHFSATSSALDLVSKGMRMYAARQARDELELRLRATRPAEAEQEKVETEAAAGEARGRRRRRLLRDINAAIEALSWMHGGDHRPAPRQMSASTEKKILGLQADVRQRVVEAASRWCDVDSAVSERGALARLLKGRSGYAPAPSCSVGSYEYSKVSMPSDLHDSPSLISMLPSEARKHLEDFEKLMLRPAQESELIKKCEGVPGCHTDPALQKDPRTYGRLVRRVARVGMVTFTRDPACVLGVFFVTKKADKLRLIVDCRRANQLFQKPPGVALLSGKGLSRVEIDDPEGLLEGLPVHLGVGDVADCFHRMRLAKTAGGDIRRYFCWPPLASKYAGVSEVDGVAARPDEKIWPMCASLPMGFSWSLHFAQTANAQRLGRQPALRQSQDLATTCMSTTLACSTFDGDLVGRALAEAQRDFDADALRFHEMEVFDHGGPSLGWHLDGDARVAGPSDKRFALVRRGVRALLRLRKVSGWQVEAVLGHVTFLFLMRRELLSIFHTVYRFVRESYMKFQRLWVGRVPELSRYRLGGTRAREHAFEVEVDPESGDRERDFLGRPARLDREAREILEAARWEHNEDFAEVPSRLFAGDRWHTILADRWLHADDILRLEARAAVKAGARALHVEAVKNCRVLLLGWPGFRAGPARARTTEAFLVQVADEIPDRLAGAPGPAGRDAPADVEGEDGSESDDSSDPEERAATAARQRALGRRGKNHVYPRLSALMGAALSGARPTPLEARSVTRTAAAQCRQRVLAFLSWGPFSETVEDPARRDVALTDLTNHEFEQDRKNWRAEELLAGIISHSPRYKKNGYDKPRLTLRALKGWCRGSPSRLRRPLTVGMWVSFAVEIANSVFLMAAVLALPTVERYLRPGEKLGLTLAFFRPPAHGGVATGVLPLFPRESSLLSKTVESDDNIPLDSKRVFRALSKRPQGSERLLDWNYRESVSVPRRFADNLNGAVVQYRGLHTRASADRAESLRTQKQVMKREKWQAVRCVRRCGEAGRVHQAWRELVSEGQ
ncbi:unnamed protein product, partial [Prorocentrum cordatum]